MFKPTLETEDTTEDRNRSIAHGTASGAEISEPEEPIADAVPKAARTRSGTPQRGDGDSVVKPPHIPDGINEMDRLEAAGFYLRTLGWAVHPLYAPDKGNERERGKKPLHKGWRNHTAADIDEGYLEEHFGAAATNNIGVVVRAPFAFVDLDSKADGGASVCAWIAGQPDLAAVPRERTAGGAHLAFICRDLPGEILKLRQAPTVAINGQVHAELYVEGMNLVVSPSVHKSGHRYRHEVTGVIPEVAWLDLCNWFGFTTPPPKRPAGRPPKTPPWWAHYAGDLATLDLVAALNELNVPVARADEAKAMWAIRCPWDGEHSTPATAGGAPAADTVVFNPPGSMPGFNCMHAHSTV